MTFCYLLNDRSEVRQLHTALIPVGNRRIGGEDVLVDRYVNEPGLYAGEEVLDEILLTGAMDRFPMQVAAALFEACSLAVVAAHLAWRVIIGINLKPTLREQSQIRELWLWPLKIITAY